MKLEEVIQYIHWFLNKHNCDASFYEDAFQQCFLRYWEKKSLVDENKSSESTYLYFICSSAYLNFIRDFVNKSLTPLQEFYMSHNNKNHVTNNYYQPMLPGMEGKDD